MNYTNAHNIENPNYSFDPIELLGESTDESITNNDHTEITQTTGIVADNLDSSMYTPSFYR